MFNVLTPRHSYAVLLALFILLAFSTQPAFAKIMQGNATQETPSANSTSNSTSYDEETYYPQNDELVGHTPEEAASYATELPDDDLPIQSGQAGPLSGSQASCEPFNNSTNSTSKPIAKIVPPKGKQPSALRLFRLLPPTIFENTIEGLREDEKQLLMDSGETEFWVMTALSDEELVIGTKSLDSDTQATLKLFRANSGDTIIAMGVTSGDACALELWKCDLRGRITPMPMPDEPAISEFLEANRVLPEDTDVSMLICLDPLAEGLEAKPLIWTPSGIDPVRLDTRVIYTWNGDAFVKKVEPIEK